MRKNAAHLKNKKGTYHHHMKAYKNKRHHLVIPVGVTKLVCMWYLKQNPWNSKNTKHRMWVESMSTLKELGKFEITTWAT